MNLSTQLRETVRTIRVKPYALTDLIPLLIEAADLLDKYEQVLQSIANEHIELSHDKIKWQCEDHVRWAKEVLK